MKVSCRLATWFWIFIISKQIWKIVSFVILYSFICVIVTTRILLILLCSKTSSLFRSVTRKAQLSHIYSRRFMGMARKIKYFWGGWLMCASKSDSMLPLMRRRRRVFYQIHSRCEDYTKKASKISEVLCECYKAIWNCDAVCIICFIILFVLLLYLLFIIIFLCVYGNQGGADVNCGRIMTWGFEKYGWRK